MADITNLSKFLTDVANAIREKRKTGEKIQPMFFDTEIKSIESGVKLFETKEDMHADENANTDDLAIVYGEKSGPANLTAVFNSVTFPKTVVLPTAVSSTLMTIFGNEAGDYCQCRLTRTTFQLYNYLTPGKERITYSSSDGKTYTRTDAYGDTLELGSPCMFTEDYGWDDRFGYFMQVSSANFEGLFQYAPTDDENIITTVDIPNSTIPELYSGMTLAFKTIDITGVIDKLRQIGLPSGASKYNIIIDETRDGEITKVLITKNGYITLLSTNEWYMNFAYSSGDITAATAYLYDLKNMTVETKTYEEMLVVIGSESSPVNRYVFNDITGKDVFAINSSFETVNIGMTYKYNSSTTSVAFANNYDATTTFGTKYEYQPAPNQFSLRNPNQLLEGVSALGNQGEIIGDGSIYDNLDKSAIVESFFVDMNKEGSDIWCSVSGDSVKYFKEDRQGLQSFAKVKNPISVKYTQPMSISSDKTKAYVLTNSTTSTVYDLTDNTELKVINHPSDSGNQFQKYHYAVEFGDIICYIDDLGKVHKLNLLTLEDVIVIEIPLEANPYQHEYRFFKISNSEILLIYAAHNKTTYTITMFAKLLKLKQDNSIECVDIVNYTQPANRNSTNIIYQYVSDEKIWIDISYANKNNSGIFYCKMFEYDRINGSEENTIVLDRQQNNSGIMNSLNISYAIPYNNEGFFGYGTSSSRVYYYDFLTHTVDKSNYRFQLPDGTAISPSNVYKFFNGLAYFYNNRYWFIKDIKISYPIITLYADDCFVFNMYNTIDGTTNSISFTIDIDYDAENRVVKSKPYKGSMTTLDYAETKSITECESNLSDYTLLYYAPYLFGSMMVYGLDGERLMGVMEEIMPTGETFDGLGGTEEEIENVADEILGNK